MAPGHRPGCRASKAELSKANTWRRDGSEFLMADVWTRFRPAGSGHENTTAFDDVAGLLPISTE